MRKSRFSFFLLFLTILSLCWLGEARPAQATTRPTRCLSYQLPVALASGLPLQYSIYGELCNPSSGPSHTVQLLLPGSTYNHTYWDFPTIDGVSYSYVQAANAAGYSTLNIDRIGTGQSSHPDLALVSVTIETNAYIVHEIVQDLLNGEDGLQAFRKVLLVGHSLGSITALVEAGTLAYNDVSGVILTGLLHLVNATALTALATTLYPAILDPSFITAGYGLSYITTEPGTRVSDFYYAPNADPNVVARDEATKDIASLGELATFVEPLILGTSEQITVPVLLVVGQQDDLFCGLLANNCSCAATVLQAEAPYYSPQAHLQVDVVPASGHDVNLQPGHDAQGNATSPAWFSTGLAWSEQYVAP